MIQILNKKAFLRSPSAILLDLDDTLYAYEPCHREALKAAQELSVKEFSLRPDEFKEAYENAKSQIKGQLKETAASHSRLLYFQRTIELLGFETQIHASLELEQTYWRTFLSQMILYEGCRQFLHEAKLLGIPICVVTDLTTSIQFRKLIFLELEREFNFVVTSEEAGFDKPSEKPFLLALKKLGVKGELSWFIGDNSAKDIEGAKKTIGAVTLQKVDEKKNVCSQIQPDLLFDDFLSLRDLLRKIGASNTKIS